MYPFLKQLIKASLFFFFKHIVVNGKEHIPDKGPLILVANHPNTFMDPLLIASITRQRIGFIGNAGIFSNKIIAKILRFFHVIPIFRKKDLQPGEKSDNKQAFMQCHDYLSRQGTFLIFPEGTSYYELKLREIKTGTARIALSYEALKNFEGNLKIIPIALDYSDAIQFRSIVSITVCPAITVAAYKQKYEQHEFDAVVQLTEDIRKELAKNIPHTSGKEQEEFLLKAHQFYTTFYAPQSALQKNPKQSLEVRNQVSKALQFLQEKNANLYGNTQSKVLQFFKMVKMEGLTPDIISNSFFNKNKLFVLAFSMVKFLVLFPIYILGLGFNYLPYILPEKIFKLLKLDIEYKAPVQMIAGLLTFPLFYTGIIWLYRIYISTEFWQTLLLLFVMPLTGYFTMYYYAAMKRFIKLLHYNFFMEKSKKQKIIALRDEILNIVEEAGKKLKVTILIVLLSFLSCTKKETITYEWKTLQVTATAYNSSKYQTDGDPFIGAFGDSLKPDIKSIAVSRDLYRLGLKKNTPVTIEGLEGIYLVKDRMHGRWKNKIDIYMGTDLQAAKNWGRKKLTIQYGIPIEEEPK